MCSIYIVITRARASSTLLYVLFTMENTLQSHYICVGNVA